MVLQIKQATLVKSKIMMGPIYGLAEFRSSLRHAATTIRTTNRVISTRSTIRQQQQLTAQQQQQGLPQQPRIQKRVTIKKKKEDDVPTSTQLFLHAGFPLLAFSLMAAWVIKSSIEGKTKEYEKSRGQVSKSVRQARMEEEQTDMLEKLSKIRKTDFDNTKRIERPEEILERRKRERERRNVWYRRWGRWIIGRE